TPEGCLSIPGKAGYVKRPDKVTVRAMDRDGNVYEKTGTGLLAKAFCHEIDHLSGILYIDKVNQWVSDEE
ncbi:MAG: peptide deformylase, partial [Firmicutes bacterium]|nr:peptide deformylase [Bacillota bacterium]